MPLCVGFVYSPSFGLPLMRDLNSHSFKKYCLSTHSKASILICAQNTYRKQDPSIKGLKILVKSAKI